MNTILANKNLVIFQEECAFCPVYSMKGQVNVPISLLKAITSDHKHYAIPAFLEKAATM